MTKYLHTLILLVVATAMMAGCAKCTGTLNGTSDETLKKSYIEMWKNTAEKDREKLHYAYVGLMGMSVGAVDFSNWDDWLKARNNLLDGRDAKWILKYGTPYMDAFLTDWDTQISEMEKEMEEHKEQNNQAMWEDTNVVLQDYKLQRKIFLGGPETMYEEYFEKG